jgi:ribonuclease VapC
MVIDTSALVAILQGEPERRAFIDAIDGADAPRLSTASFVEASIVVEARFGPDGVHALDRFLDRAGVELVAVDREQSLLARSAFSRFGRGRHPAGLNYGDCFAHALATALAEPLLFKGDDFARTDVAVARLPKADAD